ncbi:MAG: hypoxanthine phosphoribosyltransferase [candidate division KSB1 bacterium]|nr:hypoxanthine phosphoribosyltransferase [candidate division KSB1 bacterium]MDZ7339198.1 hypoxanthine phosphoribosyltransferase [candidate division KSB1 bacterium]MDZ7394113.1 hypoxanthine phosphoribosyltransferase [candidate division KSB1 bacterium]MDZ7414235.1 hypoxanthine phosphoribosyltransferase [candidate division KSB1 bacterium]
MAGKSEKQKAEAGQGYKLMLSPRRIQRRIKELAKELSRDYRGRVPVLIGVLNGGFIFLADLIRHLEIDCEVDFMKISSYGDETMTSGWVKLLKDVDCQIEGRDVIVVEDIVDSGLSIQFLQRRLQRFRPRSLKYVTLLLKEGAARVPYEVDYVGFRIPNEFVVGYGLDQAQLLRNLSGIYVKKG